MTFERFLPELEERFVRYVQVDTQSDESSPTSPSTAIQYDLIHMLADELRAIGASDVIVTEYGAVLATIPATPAADRAPTVALLAHVDTAPAYFASGVKPLVHRRYNGQTIVLPDNPKHVLSPHTSPTLANKIGEDIVTASGTTLLGADDKAGVAIAVTVAAELLRNPSIPHGRVRIGFTPDEEIGRGVDKVDMEKLGADYGYTVDGEKLGSLEDETFSADAVTIDIRGISIHPGFAKGKLESALKIAADIVAALPKDRLSPETTGGKEGFIHPVSISGGAELAKIEFIIRDFTDEKLESHENVLRDIMNRVLKNYPNSRAEFKVTEQYRNMKKVLDQHPQVVENAMEAMRRAGVTPLRSSIRGGTDGSRLSFMGLPCPNIFAGEQAFHSREEWASVQDMEKAVAVIVELARVWEEGA